MPETYAPPVQRQPFENFRPYRANRIVSMADGDADAHIVRDITPAAQPDWRWTRKRPTVHVTMRTNENVKYTMDFAIAEATLKDTGPVTLSFYVNDHLLDTVRYAASGPQHFEKPIPAGWIMPGQEATVAAEIDKVWVSKLDGAQLGFILMRIGLTQ
jgi:hypothetical protein